MEVVRYDENEWPAKAELTPEGYLRVDAPITRMGVLQYQQPDGSSRGELRHPEDWSTPAALEALRSLPITDGHPPPRPSDGQPLVDAQSAKRLSIGWNGSVRAEGAFLRSPILIADADGVASVQRGRRGTSTGVVVELREERGTYDGQSYEFRQIPTKGNHIAIVDSPRAGTMIRLDSDGNQTLPGDTRGDTMETKKLSTVVLDGINYEAAPEVANALAKSQARVTELETKLDATDAKVKETATERDALKAKVDAFEKRDLSSEISEGVKARTTLLDMARKALPAEQHAKIDEMSDAEIKKAVVVAKLPSFRLDGRSDQEVAIAYDIAVAEVARTDEDNREREQAIGEQRRVTAPRQDAIEDTLDAAVKRAEERISNQWKQPAA